MSLQFRERPILREKDAERFLYKKKRVEESIKSRVAVVIANKLIILSK